MTSLDDHIRGIAENVLSSIKESFQPGFNASATSSSATPQFAHARSSYEAFMGFVHAVDWTEPWIQIMIAAEVIILIAAVLTRKMFEVQAAVFVTISCVHTVTKQRDII